MDTSTPGPGRRRFFARIVNTVHAAVAGTLGVVLGGVILSPGLAKREENWLPAARLGDLVDGSPVPVTLRVVREDGYRQIVDRRTVFLVKSADQVTALDPTCTHLGCRVSWDAATRELRCPCHGGVYDHMGMVKSGPPPSPLPRLTTRIDDSRVFVQI